MLLWSVRPGDCLNLIGPEIVFDPSNYASNLIQQFESIKQTIMQGTMIANQAIQIEHEVQSLIYQAQNLQKNPLQLLSQLKSLWNQYNNIMRDAEGLSYSLAQSGAQFTTAYPHLAGTPIGASIADMGAASSRMLASIRAASVTAVKSQSVYERLCQQLDAQQAALDSAQKAQGALQIAQAQAQLAALQSEQLAELAQIEAANGRVQTEWIVKQAQDEAIGRASNARWQETFGAGGFKDVKKGEGVKLP
jgi:P-type conjugative transfer protein TrbJ